MTVEWVAVTLVVAVALGAAVAAGVRVDGRSFGGFLAHSIVCAVRGGCDTGDDLLAAAYGESDAALVREWAPGLVYEPGVYTLPIDFRDCRSHRCSDAPDDRDLDAHRSARGGLPATAFTRVVRSGGETFIQYWLYYPTSTTTLAGSAGAWSRARAASGGRLPQYPGFHLDDWESAQVRIDRSGRAYVRASSHRGYQGCKQARCRNRWTEWTGWSRVSRGSHAGHIPLRGELRGAELTGEWPLLRLRYRDHPLYPGTDLRERTTSAAGLRLVPLETIDRSGYRRLDPGISPPWEKEVYDDPRSNSTG